MIYRNYEKLIRVEDVTHARLKEYAVRVSIPMSVIADQAINDHLDEVADGITGVQSVKLAHEVLDRLKSRKS